MGVRVYVCVCVCINLTLTQTAIEPSNPNRNPNTSKYSLTQFCTNNAASRSALRKVGSLFSVPWVAPPSGSVDVDKNKNATLALNEPLSNRVTLTQVNIH